MVLFGFFFLFPDSLKLFRKLPFKKKKKGFQKENFRYYLDLSCTKIASGLSAHEDLWILLSLFFLCHDKTDRSENCTVTTLRAPVAPAFFCLGVRAQSTTLLCAALHQDEILSLPPYPSHAPLKQTGGIPVTS